MSAAPRSTRREFLQGKAAADALTQTFDQAWAPDELPASGDAYLVKFSRRAMACQFEVILNAGQYPLGTEAALAALDLVDQLEDQLSVYREHSEISRINRHAALESVPVEPRLFELLQTAVRLHGETQGAYDITAGSLSSAWGFTYRAGSIPAAEDLAMARRSVGSQFLEFDGDACSVRFLQPGMQINLGSIGKGYALDRCAELLTSAGIHDFLLHGGHSSVLARGSQGGSDTGNGWAVGVRNPLRPERRLGQLHARERALATSGSGTQFFVHEGRRYGHILDPRTGWPAEKVLSTSVLAPTAAEADALSTAFYVMGPDDARLYCQTHDHIAAVVLCPGQRQGSIQKHFFGLEEDEWTSFDDS